MTAMADDFNTPDAISVLFNLARELNRMADSGQVEHARELCGQLITLAGVLGLLYQDPETFLKGLGDSEEPASLLKAEWIEQQIHERSVAREQVTGKEPIRFDATSRIEGLYWRIEVTVRLRGAQSEFTLANSGVYT